MSLLQSIHRDIKAALEKDPAARSAIEVALTYPGFHARQLHRLAQIAIAMGDSELFHPVVLAWLPTILFLLAALVLLNRVRS